MTRWLIMMMTAHPTDTVVPRGPSRQTSALVEAALTPTGRHRLPPPRYCNAQTAVEKINLGICFCVFLFVYFYLCILFVHFICAFYFGLCRLTAPMYCSVPTVEKIHPLQIHKESTSFVLPNYCTENITF